MNSYSILKNDESKLSQNIVNLLDRNILIKLNESKIKRKTEITNQNIFYVNKFKSVDNSNL